MIPRHQKHGDKIAPDGQKKEGIIRDRQDKQSPHPEVEEESQQAAHTDFRRSISRAKD